MIGLFLCTQIRMSHVATSNASMYTQTQEFVREVPETLRILIANRVRYLT